LWSGTVLLGGLLGVPLVLIGADGTAYALAMVTALSVGGIANYFAVKRYGVGRRSTHDHSERVPGAQG
jgi:tRNA(Glu) U13 pseudouridine synthase TruD